MTTEWIVGIALYWFFSSAAMDALMSGKDMSKYHRIGLWFVWPILLPFIGLLWLIVETS